MANRTFQRTSALALALLMLVPGWGLGQLGAQPEAPPLPRAALDLADRAFVGSFHQLDATDGAADLVAMQPSLESLLRYYARERGLQLSPPYPPTPSGEAPLAAALDALAAATGHLLPAEQRAAAARLHPELQGALASLVLAYLEAARLYTEATAGLTRADLAALARGEPLAHAPDGGKLASAALLLDRAVRESTPALRKWALLLAIEERTRHPQLSDVTPAGLLQAGARVTSPRDAVDLGSVLQGWEPVGARFEPTSARPSEALMALYAGLGVPVFADDAVAFQLLDREPEALQRLLIASGDGLSEAARRLARAEALSSPAEEDAAWAALGALDLGALAALAPGQVPVAQLEAIVQALQRADEALQLRLEAAAVLSEALAMAKDLAPQVAALPLLGGPQTQSTVDAPTLGAVDVPIPGLGGACRVDLDQLVFRLQTDDANPAVGPGSVFVGVGDALVRCPVAVPLRLPARAVFDVATRELTLFLDHDGDGQAAPDELMLRTPPTASPQNDLVFKDPYGFLLVGGEGATLYGPQFGAVNVSLRVENGTVAEERKVVGALRNVQFGFVSYDNLNRLVGRVNGGRDLNYTATEPQDNGVLNLTMNPRNHTLLVVDLGGDDAYTNRAAGAEDNLFVYDSNFLERMARSPAGGATGFDQCDGGTSGFSNDPGFFGFGARWCGTPTSPVSLFLDPHPENFFVVDDGALDARLNTTNLTIPLRLGAVLDTSGSDRYDSPQNFSLGASRTGVGLLWDAERCHPEAAARPLPCSRTSPGHDVYVGGNNTTAAANQRGVGILVDEHGDDQRTVRGNHSLGAGSNRGVALLVDQHGKDTYFAGNYSMGFGGRERFGDCMVPPGPISCFPLTNVYPAVLFAASTASTRPGLGVLLDRQGDDAYAQLNASSAQGKGWPALGLLLDLGGADTGLQTTLNATSEAGTVGLGFQDSNLLAFEERLDPTAPVNVQGVTLTRPLEWGRGGGLILDAEVQDTSGVPTDPDDLQGDGVGMSATEVQGGTSHLRCPAQAAVLGTNRCDQQPDLDRDFHPVSRQSFLLRVPGLFGLGGTRSHNDREAPVAEEEHLLHLDLGGHDVYRGPFGGAAVPDLGELDADGSTSPDDKPPNYAPLYRGGLLAPLMLNLDLGGADTYDARTGLLGTDNATGRPARRNLSTPSLGGAHLGIGLLYDLGLAPDQPRPAREGVPEACAAPGKDDVYVAFNRTMGYGALFGIGALVDREGDDCYLAVGGDAHALLPKAHPGGCAPSAAPQPDPALALGAACLGGLGALVDARGNDTYHGGVLSQGAAILERVNEHLPARVQAQQLHGPDTVNTDLADPASVPPNAFGAFLDGRGADRYVHGAELSQGWGAAFPSGRVVPSATGPPSQVPGPANVTAGLFVDDGFDRDNYTSLRPLAPGAQPHGDNRVWCTRPVEALQGQALPAQVHPEATCLDLDLRTNPASVTLGSLGRGFDNLDFFANFLLAAGTFGQEFAKSRSVLTSPAVVDVACANATGALPPVADWPRSCLGLRGAVQVRAQVLWGPASVAYNTVELLRHVCAKGTEDPAACDGLLLGATVRDLCASKPASHTPAVGACQGATNLDTLRGACRTAAGASGAAPAVQEQAANCRDRLGPLGLRLPGDLLRAAPGQDVTNLSVFGDALRNLTFALRAPGAPADGSEDIPLGGFDRRLELAACGRNATTGAFGEPCRANVSAPDADGVVWLRWDTTAVVPRGADAVALRAPDGVYDLVVHAHLQFDRASCPAEPPQGCPLDPLPDEDHRYVLNRLGDEYGFYPGAGVARAALDNGPVVYEMDVHDVSFAPRCTGADDTGCAERPPELHLNLTLSPPLGAAALDVGLEPDPAYRLLAEVRRGEAQGPLTLEPREFPCGEAPRDASGLPVDGEAEPSVLDPDRLLDVRCTYSFGPEGDVTVRTGWRFHRSVAGTEVPARPAGLVDDAYTLVVRVVEGSAHDPLAPTTVRCFVRHGGPLAESAAPDCHAPFVVDSDPPRTTARFDPARTARDGAVYVNRTVAYRSLELAFHPQAALTLGGARACAGEPLAAWVLPFTPPAPLPEGTRCVRAVPYVDGRPAEAVDVAMHDAPFPQLRVEFAGDALCATIPVGNLTVPARGDDQVPPDGAAVRCVRVASSAEDYPLVASVFGVRSLRNGGSHGGASCAVHQGCAAVPVALAEEPGEDPARASPLTGFALRARLGTVGVEATTAVEQTLAGPLGALTVAPCDMPPGCLVVSGSRSQSRVTMAIEGLATDLAGNRERALPPGEAEALGTLDVDPPTSQLCTAVSTSVAAAPEAIPRQRTRDRAVTFAWGAEHGRVAELDAAGNEVVSSYCQPDPHGEVVDNDAVEAVTIAYAVRPRFPEPFVHELDRLWEPGEAEQAQRLARFDFAAQGLDGVLTNNRTLYAVALAVDKAGNVQDRDLARSRTTYDDQGPELTLLNLTAEHDRVLYRWRAEDREVDGRVPEGGSFVLWGPVDPLTGAANLSQRAEANQVGLAAQAVIAGLLQNTTYAFEAWSLDDVGNPSKRPLEVVATEPVVRLAIDSPQPHDLLRGTVPLRLNISGVRVDPVFEYKVTVLVATPNGTLALEADRFVRRECIAPEADCPTLGSTVLATRQLATARFPDAREAWIRVEANNTVNPGRPVVVSVGPLRIDNTPPVTEPRPEALGGPVWFRSAVLHRLDATDAITDVARTEYSLDNRTFEAYNASSPPVFDREGTATVFFRSTDGAGNVEALRTATVSIDRQRPTGRLVLHGGAEATGSRNITLALEAQDALAGVANLTLDTGGAPVALDNPSRFATARTLPLELPAQDGERRVRVRVLDKAGNALELKESILLDTTPPEVTHLKVERVSHTTATLGWRTGEPSPSRVEYGPLNALVLANRFESNASQRSHLVLLQGLRPSMDYQYRVVAEDAVGNRATLRGAFETLPDTVPPGGAVGLRAEDLGNGVLSLHWEPAFDNVGVEHYVVYRGVAGDLEELARVAEPLFLDDTGLPGTSYEYAVRAVDLAGLEGPLSASQRGRATTRPQFLEPSVDPARGPATQVFTYRVVVRDPDGDAPWSVRVRVGDRAFEMTPQFEGRADFARGVPYQASLRLPATTLSGGFPTYQFEAEDARGKVVGPDKPLAGPAVLGAGAVLPDLQGARDVLGLPGFGAVLAAAAALAVALVLRRRRGGGP